MSGLYPPGCEDYLTDDVDDRYLKTAAAAEDFIVTQMGLSLFTWAGSHYEARSFNFHLFPSPSEELDLRFSCQASSLAFLAGHGFDFNKVNVFGEGGAGGGAHKRGGDWQCLMLKRQVLLWADCGSVGRHIRHTLSGP
jgi:hypothetical protein